MLEQISDHIFLSIARYLTISDWSSIGAMSRYFAYENKSIWTGLHSLQFYGIGEVIDDINCKTVQMNDNSRKKKHHTVSVASLSSRRVTRSVSYPRVAFFNALRARVISYEQLALTAMNALRQSDALKLVESTLTSGFPMNRIYHSCDQSTVLGVCARYSRWKTAKHLVLHRGADLNQPDVHGMTPLLVAAWKGDLLGVKTLLSLGRQAYEKRERGELQEPAVHTTNGDAETKTVSSSSSSSDFSSSSNSSSHSSRDSNGNIHGSGSNSVLNLTVCAAPAMTSVCGSKVENQRGLMTPRHPHIPRSTLSPSHSIPITIASHLQSTRISCCSPPPPPLASDVLTLILSIIVPTCV